ncbi:MAG: Kae1-associated kinase Bud32 [Thermoprotei archaeon]|jgi:Kae1-associated kinase Bud32
MSNLEFLSEGSLIAKGAEAELWSGTMLGMPVVIKKRVSKAYRDPSLDFRLRANRTFEEGRLISKAYLAGVSVPAPLYIDPISFILVESFIKGELLRDIVDRQGLMKSVGVEVAKMHKTGMVHGDLTTSNVLISDKGKPVIIDFGLGAFSSDLEDLGVDMLLMKKSLEANVPTKADKLYSEFVEGYREVAGTATDEVYKKAEEIERRGRYFRERVVD